MFEILVVALFIWLVIKTFGLFLGLAWGTAKIIGCLLMVLALPVLLLCLLFAGGVVLLLPVALVGAAFWVLKAAL